MVNFDCFAKYLRSFCCSNMNISAEDVLCVLLMYKESQCVDFL